MHTYELAHVSDTELLRRLDVIVARDRAVTAALLAHIAEVDARELYRPAGYESMHAYCVGALHLSEDAAFRRIQAARVSRKFPQLFEAVAAGRLHLSAVSLIAPHLTPENVVEMIERATHRTNIQIREMLIRMFPVEPEPAPVLRLTPGPTVTVRPVVGAAAPSIEAQLGPDQVGVPSAEVPAALAPSAEPDELELRLVISRRVQDKFRYAQALLSHAVPAQDSALVLERALDALIEKCEKRKFGAAVEARQGNPKPIRGRHIPPHVRRAVWKRDEGRCTHVSAGGVRCGSRTFLEFDHIVPVARGGLSTVENVRMRCREHNQDDAKKVFGARFMRERKVRAMVASKRAHLNGAANPPPVYATATAEGG